MICKLCDQEKDLIYAHIIPRAFYREIMPPDGQALLVIRPDLPYEQRARNGEYDTEILCAECDQYIGQWDQVAIEFFRSIDSWEIVEYPAGRTKGYIVKKFNYKALKLFCISMLWRAGISKRPFSQNVQLGPYEKLAKQLILNEDHGPENLFSIVLTKYAPTKLPQYEKSRDVMHKNILSPQRKLFYGTLFYEFTLNEFNAYIKTTNKPIPKEFNSLLLKQDHPLNILEFDFDNSRKHKNLFHEIKELEKREEAHKSKKLISSTTMK